MKKRITIAIMVFLAILSLNSCERSKYDEISPDDYVLSPDGLTLLQWFKKDVKGIDFQSDSILSKITSINEKTFSEIHSLKNVILPKNLKEIKPKTFQNSGLENIILTSSIKTIESAAFFGCSSLTTVTIPEGVTKIDEYAFMNCESLEDITIPNSVTYIGDFAFQDCISLKKVIVSNNLIHIGDSAFERCYSLETITIPNKVIEIGNNAFKGCSSLKSITIPNSVTEIGENAFAYCGKLKTVVLPKSITKINNSTFESCSSLTTLSIPNNIIEIGAGAFAYCENLISIDIPEGVEKIGVGYLDLGVFERCNSLVSITLPSTIKEIGHKAFHNCEKLTFIIFKSLEPPLITINENQDKVKFDPWYHYHKNNPLIKDSPIKAIYVPIESVNIYKNNMKWYEPIWGKKCVIDKYILDENRKPYSLIKNSYFSNLITPI